MTIFLDDSRPLPSSRPVQSFADLLLLVEDTESDAQVLITTLEKMASSITNVKVAKNGAEAIEFLSQIPPTKGKYADDLPRLILLDLNMPRMDGFQFLQHVKAHRVLRSIPIVVFAADNDEKTVKRCFELGANGFLFKPVDYAGYKKVIDEIHQYWFQSSLRLMEPAIPERDESEDDGEAERHLLR